MFRGDHPDLDRVRRRACSGSISTACFTPAGPCRWIAHHRGVMTSCGAISAPRGAPHHRLRHPRAHQRLREAGGSGARLAVVP